MNIHSVWARVDMNHMFAFNPYNDDWRDQRKLFQQYFSPKNAIIIEERIEMFLRKSLLPNLLRSPQNYRLHLHEYDVGLHLQPL